MFLRIRAAGLAPRVAGLDGGLFEIGELGFVGLVADRHHVELDADALVVILRRDACTERSHVAALRDVLVEAQVHHQLVQHGRALGHGELAVGGARGERVAWERGHDDVVGQVFGGRVLLPDEIEHGQEFDEGARPPVQELDGHGVLLLGEQGDEVQVDAVDLHAVVGEGVDSLFFIAPGVGVEPVVARLGEPFVSYTVFAIFLRTFPGLGWQFGELEELAPVVYVLVWDVEGEGLCGAGG